MSNIGPVNPGSGKPGSRHDLAMGLWEEAGFFGAQGSIFGSTYLPEEPAIGGLVVCSPLYAEFMTNYRREVLLARTLAGRGMAVQRFHYRGTGNSYGDPAHNTFSSMRDDALTAADQLQHRSGIAEIAFVGTRIGAMVAGAAASRMGDAPLVLWEPVVAPERYFREAFRASLIRDLKESSSERRTASALLETMRAEGVVDVLGYSIHEGLYDSLIELDLASEIGEARRRVLIVQLGRAEQLRGENKDLVSALEAVGTVVEGRVVTGNEAWWFVNEPTRSKAVTKDVVDLTTDWLLGTLQPGVLKRA